VLTVLLGVVLAGGVITVVAHHSPSALPKGFRTGDRLASSRRTPPATTVRWITAIATNDAAVACALMSARAQADFHPGSVETCEQAVRDEFHALTPAQARALSRPAIRRSSTRGDTSVVRVSDIQTDSDPSAGFLDQFTTITLTREPGGWLITGLAAGTPQPGDLPA
jgi:hypothetical protein